jgi:hypothetical protein
LGQFETFGAEMAKRESRDFAAPIQPRSANPHIRVRNEQGPPAFADGPFRIETGCGARLGGGGRTRTIYSNPAVAVLSKCPTKGSQERCLLRPSVPATKSLIVDRPLRLREIPAPFTSRSPGIATLGPSCTPRRQLGSVVQLSKAQRSGCRDIVPFGTP